MHNKLTTALHILLDKEQSALLSADYETLPILQGDKERLIAMLSSIPQEHQTLLAIKSKIERNQALLRGAIDGIAAAQLRISELEKVQQNLSVYDPSGKIEIAQYRVGIIEKKA